MVNAFGSWVVAEVYPSLTFTRSLIWKRKIDKSVKATRTKKRRTKLIRPINYSNYNDAESFEDATIADAVLDRIVHSSIRIEMKGESMRKILAKTQGN